MTPDCQPIAGAVMDFWHCDDAGVYDNAGFRYRGHQFTDASGAYRLRTIRPGKYPARTQHILLQRPLTSAKCANAVRTSFKEMPGNFWRA